MWPIVGRILHRRTESRWCCVSHGSLEKRVASVLAMCQLKWSDWLIKPNWCGRTVLNCGEMCWNLALNFDDSGGDGGDGGGVWSAQVSNDARFSIVRVTNSNR